MAKQTLMNKKFRVNTGSVGGFFYDDVVQGEDLKRVFIDEANIERHLSLGSLVEYSDEPVELSVDTETAPDSGEPKPIGSGEPGEINQSEITTNPPAKD